MAAEPNQRELARVFADTVSPFVQTYCQSCHGNDKPKGKLDLSAYSTLEKVATEHTTWQMVLERLEAKEMPPEEAKRQPTQAERQAIIAWIRAVRTHDAARNAGDPGIVPARRLNAAEYNYTIRDLTGVDIRP
ncbi:MAG TPA: c-type cytochrome domain-containing protein, partial [Pirellulaceae bacterium]|nr:c-type cytochrome domain-containing protein [Pirellulaceae bacterium]